MRIAFAGLLLVLAAGVARAQDRVLVLPFNVEADPSQAWMSTSIQDNIVHNLDRAQKLDAVAYHGIPLKDNAAAARAALAQKIPYAMRGLATAQGKDVTLTAELIEAKTGTTIYSVTSAGSASELLQLEEDISAQMHVEQPLATPRPEIDVPSVPALNLQTGTNSAPARYVVGGGIGMPPNMKKVGQHKPPHVQGGYTILNNYYAVLDVELVDGDTGKILKWAVVNGTTDHFSSLVDQAASQLNGGSSADQRIHQIYSGIKLGPPKSWGQPFTPNQVRALYGQAVCDGVPADSLPPINGVAPAPWPAPVAAASATPAGTVAPGPSAPVTPPATAGSANPTGTVAPVPSTPVTAPATAGSGNPSGPIAGTVAPVPSAPVGSSMPSQSTAMRPTGPVKSVGLVPTSRGGGALPARANK